MTTSSGSSLAILLTLLRNLLDRGFGPYCQSAWMCTRSQQLHAKLVCSDYAYTLEVSERLPGGLIVSYDYQGSDGVVSAARLYPLAFPHCCYILPHPYRSSVLSRLGRVWELV